MVGLALPGAVTAQMIVEPNDRPAERSDREFADDSDGERRVGLPQPMPPITRFDAMQPFDVDSGTPFGFAWDPASLRLDGRVAMLASAARSPSGAVTTGYYGFDCERGNWRLLAIPDADRGWRAASSASRWQPVIGTDDRNRRFRALAFAICQNKRPIADAREIQRRLSTGNPETSRF